MKDTITIKATVAVWLSNSEYGAKPQDLLDAVDRGNYVAAMDMLSFYGPPTKERFADCVRVGEADITLRLLSRDEQTRMALESLNEQLKKLRAAYTQRQQEIMAQISKLQALTNEVSA